MLKDIDATATSHSDVETNNKDFTGPGQRNLQLDIDPIDYPNKSKNKDGSIRVLNTHKNLRWLLSKYSASIQYNLMRRQGEIIFPGMTMPIDDLANYQLGLVEHIATLHKMPISKIAAHLDMIALENSYHPIVKCIQDKPWDGVQRLEQFIQTLESDNPELTLEIVRTWMVAAIAAAHSDSGFINQGVLVIQGPQNIGKTTFVKNLDPINCKAVKEGVFLDPTNKDSISQIASFWIVELGELDSIFGKAAIGRLKSYITMEYDLLRTPYARKPTTLSRRTAYVATVNELQYLVDDTGNRRWWTIAVTQIHRHNLDMQQVWAEVYAIWQMGHLTCLDHKLQEQLNIKNQSHQLRDPIEEKLLTEYDWDTTRREKLTATQILEGMGYKNVTRAMTQKLGYILAKINPGQKAKSNGDLLHSVPYRLLRGNKY